MRRFMCCYTSFVLGFREGSVLMRLAVRSTAFRNEPSALTN